MGGAIVRFKAEGMRVGVLDLTDGEPTPFGSVETRAAETASATEILGLDWRGNLGLANRSLQPTLEARRQLAVVFRQLKPRLLFSPYWVDAHPDHVAAVELIEAARFWSKLTKTDMPGEPHHPSRILYYNCVHLRLVEKPALRARHQRAMGNEAGRHRVLSQPVHHRPADGAAHVCRSFARPGCLLGLVDRHGLWRGVCQPRTRGIGQHSRFAVTLGRWRRSDRHDPYKPPRGPCFTGRGAVP